MKIVCETKRLIIRELTLNDTSFILRLLNEESFIRYIGNKNVKSKKDAVKYLNDGAIASYKKHGFGLNIVLLKDSGLEIGMCGLIKREELQHPDLGYAFLSEFCSQGYASESSVSILKEGIKTHSLKTILALTLIDNVRSNAILKKIGFSLKKTINIYDHENNLYEYLV